MNSHSLEILEYNEVLTRASRYAILACTRDSIVSPLFPAREEVLYLLDCTDEGAALLESAGPPPLEELPPLDAILDEATPEGAMLTTEELRVAALWGKTGTEARAWITNSGMTLPVAFAELAEQCRIPGSFHKSVLKYISPDGEIDDRADPELRGIRDRIRKAAATLNKSLTGLLHAPAHSDSFQDKIVTLREGRYVLPVRAGKKGRVEGIIHDRSASGETIYVEPTVTVEHNNRLISLQIEEKAVIARFLRKMTAQLNDVSPDYMRMLTALEHIDTYCARARFSRAIRGTRPHFSNTLQLNNARHPLLQVDPVPIRIDFTGKSMMLITGPNTGGKTVSLKTAGLLAMMALGGFHIPADEGSSIPFFSNIFCDIGDEQSINRNLSTFSGHMFNLKQIIRDSTSSDLVLIDEPGAGTDPSEGAALARSILEHLLEGGATVMATTHFNELKYYAHENDDIISASVAFDPDTLKPLYHLLPGQPGSSHALQIAANLEIPKKIISRARALINSDALDIEKILLSLQTRLSDAEKIHSENMAHKNELDQLKKEYGNKLATIGDRREKMIRETEEELTEAVRKFREDSDNFIRALKKRDRAPDARTESLLKEERNSVVEKALNKLPSRPDSDDEPITPMDGPLQPGDLVLIESMGKKGRVLEIMNRGKKVLIQLGNTKTALPRTAVVRLQGPEEQKIHSSIQTISRQTSVSLDIRGQRYEEAQENVRSFIDDSCTGGLSRVTIIHGKGSGSLQRATRDILDCHPYVAGYEFSPIDSGGTGSTVVELK